MALTHFGKQSVAAAISNDKAAIQGGVGCLAGYVAGAAVADKPGLLRLDSVHPTTLVVTPYYLWVDNTGDLRISSSIPTNEDSDGTVVGTQS